MPLQHVEHAVCLAPGGEGAVHIPSWHRMMYAFLPASSAAAEAATWLKCLRRGSCHGWGRSNAHGSRQKHRAPAHRHVHACMAAWHLLASAGSGNLVYPPQCYISHHWREATPSSSAITTACCYATSCKPPVFHDGICLASAAFCLYSTACMLCSVNTPMR